MANWKHTVHFDPWYHYDNISVKEKADLVAKELRRMMNLKRFKDDYELQDIIEGFDYVSGDGEPEETSEFTITQDFDARMAELYDWADCNLVWVSTR